MSKLSLSSATLACFVALAASAGCKGEDSPGSLVVTYRLGNDRSCADTGVQEIRVVLDEEDGIEDGAPCVDGEVVLEGLPVGTYTVLVEGIDQNGVVIMDNIDASETKVKIAGDGKELMPSTIALTDSPAKLQVRWDFGFTSCENVGIDAFEIEAFDEAGSDNLLTASLDCTAQPDTSAGYRDVADPERELNGRRFGQLGIQPVDSSGAEVGERLIYNFDPPTPGYTVGVTLECDELGCTGTGSPD